MALVLESIEAKKECLQAITRGTMICSIEFMRALGRLLTVEFAADAVAFADSCKHKSSNVKI